MIIKVRAFAQGALDTLIKSGASATTSPPTPRDYAAEATAVRSSIVALLPQDVVGHLDPTVTSADPLHLTLDFVSSLLADLVFERKFTDSELWKRCAGVYLEPWLRSDESNVTFSERARLHFLAIDQVSSLALRF
jgi:elongation factor 3